MGKIAFELRADVEEFAGGTVSLPGGEAFNVGEALEEGSGKIIVDPTPAALKRSKGESAEDFEARRVEDEQRAFDAMQLVEALNRYPALKTTTDAGPADGGEESTRKAAK
jgi:hypothetical protein